MDVSVVALGGAFVCIGDVIGTTDRVIFFTAKAIFGFAMKQQHHH
jgi:hypothetical protein